MSKTVFDGNNETTKITSTATSESCSKDFVIENGVLVKYKGKGGDVVIPNGVTKIGKGAFERCSKLKSVIVPDGVTDIEDKAFSNCDKLCSVSLPQSLHAIGEIAFEFCYGLKSIVIPDGVELIGDGAFMCSGLSSIVLPESLRIVYASAFATEYADELEIYYKGESDGPYMDIDGDFDEEYEYDDSMDFTWNYYREEEPEEDGNFWHYVNGNPTKW